MKIALRAVNGKIVCAENGGAEPLIANRESVGAWEMFDALTQDEHGNWIPLELHAAPAPVLPPLPPKPSVTPWAQFAGSAEEWFMSLVAGKPFGQATLAALEPTLNANGWLLTPPNAAGDRSKVSYRQREWIRVGFGEGKWVWLVQPS